MDSCTDVPAWTTEAGTASTTKATFAVNTVWLGDTDRSSVQSATAWKAYGLDLDRTTTDQKSKDVCTRFPGSASSTQQDAVHSCPKSCATIGGDNSFGANFIPLLVFTKLYSEPSEQMTSAIRAGDYTLLLMVTGLDGANQSNAGLTLDAFTAGPKVNGAWPVLATSLANPNDIDGGSKEHFPNAYITGGTFVSGAGSVTMGIPFAKGVLTFTLHHAFVIMDISLDGTRATNGTLAGVIDREELVTKMSRFAGSISKSLCGSAFDGIAQQLRQLSDILIDGSNTPGKICDGISFGIGFDAVAVPNPTLVIASPPEFDPCTDAGKD